MRINDILLETTHPLYETVLPSYHSTVRLGEDLARVLTEAALTADQIEKLFQTVQQQVTATGGNRTKIGQGVDAAITVKKAYNWLKDALKKTGPVKGFDQAFNAAANELKNATGGDQGVMRYIERYRAYAKETPEAQAVLYSALVIGCGVAGYMSLGPAGAVLKPAIVATLKFVDKLVQGEDFSTAMGAAAETFAAAEIMRWAGGAIKSIVGGGTPAVMPSHDDNVEVDGWSPEDEKLTGPARYNAQLQKLVHAHPQYPKSLAPKFVAAAAAKVGVDPDDADFGMSHPGLDAKADLAAGKANLDTPDGVKAASSGPSAAEPETPAATPGQTAYDKLAAMKNPRVQDALTKVQSQIEDEMTKYQGKDYLEHFRKIASKRLDLSLPNELPLDTADREAAARSLVNKAIDHAITNNPVLEKISGKVTDTLVTLVKDGTILKSMKTDADLENFITRGIKGYVGSMHDPDRILGNPGSQLMLKTDIGKQINDFIQRGVDSGQLDTKDFKGDSFKLNALIKMLRAQESIGFNKPALTESQVMELFAGTKFAPNLLSESQVQVLFQHIEEGWADTVGNVVGGTTKALAKGKAAVGNWAAGTQAGKAVGAVAKQIGIKAGNLTNKITADKLMSSWRAAGNPIDSTAIYKFLQQQGVDDAVLKASFKAAGIRAPVIRAAVSPQYKQLTSIIAKLSPVDKQKVIQHLQTSVTA